MSQILLVDHQSDLCKPLAAALRRMGHSPAFASTGAAAINFFRTSQPDLVVLDLMMPAMDGWLVLNWIKAASDAKLPVIVHGSSADPSLVALARELGASDYWTADCSFEQICSTIAAHTRPSLKRAA